MLSLATQYWSKVEVEKLMLFADNNGFATKCELSLDMTRLINDPIPRDRVNGLSRELSLFSPNQHKTSHRFLDDESNESLLDQIRDRVARPSSAWRSMYNT